MSPQTVGGRGVRRIYHRECAIFEVLFRLLELTIGDWRLTTVSHAVHTENAEKKLCLL
jgi:hypothetical protein